MQGSDFLGLKILIVEDDYYQACDAEAVLYEQGAEIVHTTAQLDAVSSILSKHEIDMAILDINLGSETTINLARNLANCKVPFLFHTGYDAKTLPEDLRGAPIVVKPSSVEELLGGLVELWSASPRYARP